MDRTAGGSVSKARIRDHASRGARRRSLGTGAAELRRSVREAGPGGFARMGLRIGGSRWRGTPGSQRTRCRRPQLGHRRTRLRAERSCGAEGGRSGRALRDSDGDGHVVEEAAAPGAGATPGATGRGGCDRRVSDREGGRRVGRRATAAPHCPRWRGGGGARRVVGHDQRFASVPADEPLEPVAVAAIDADRSVDAEATRALPTLRHRRAPPGHGAGP